MQGFVPIGGKIVNGGMSAIGIVPTFDEFEHRLACLGLVVEGGAIEQLAFQGGEEALTEGIIETIPTALAKSRGSVLAALIGVPLSETYSNLCMID